MCKIGLWEPAVSALAARIAFAGFLQGFEKKALTFTGGETRRGCLLEGVAQAGGRYDPDDDPLVGERDNTRTVWMKYGF